MYSYRDPSPETRINSPSHQEGNLQENLGGYVRYSLTDFPISVLLEDENNPFPLASAISLNYYVNEDDDEPSQYYYQPYHNNTDCFLETDNFPGLKQLLPLNSDNFAPDNTTLNTFYPFFSENAWDTFTDRYDIDPDGIYHTNYTRCLNTSYPCRYYYITSNGCNIGTSALLICTHDVRGRVRTYQAMHLCLCCN